MSAGSTVVDFEITRKLSDLALPDGPSALVLFRLHGRPLGWGAGRVTDGRLDGAPLVRQFLHQHAWTCALPLAERAVQGGRPLRMLDATTLLQSPPPSVSSGPLVTVAVRSRTARESASILSRLAAASRLPRPSISCSIDASDDRKQVEALIRDRYPQIRYSSAPGLGMASRRAIAECRGDILAVTDGDAVVDRHWVSALVNVFLSDPEVMTVSGLGAPAVLRRPFRPTLPAGAPFCRHWWRVREDYDRSTALHSGRWRGQVPTWPTGGLEVRCPRGTPECGSRRRSCGRSPLRRRPIPRPGAAPCAPLIAMLIFETASSQFRTPPPMTVFVCMSRGQANP